MKKKIPKTRVEKEIEEFFKDIKNRSPKEIKKIKRIARSYKICMKDYKRKFCKKCFTPYKNPKIRIKNKIKAVKCKNCEYITRYNLNFS